MIQSDQLVPVPFPDVAPCDLPPNVPFCMAAGDFVEVYKEPSTSNYCGSKPPCFSFTFIQDSLGTMKQLLADLSTAGNDKTHSSRTPASGIRLAPNVLISANPKMHYLGIIHHKDRECV